MPISHFLKNKLENSSHTDSKNLSSQGFTILECILAVGVLSLTIASIVGLQSSIVSVSRTSTNKIYATWALRSAQEQVDYILDVQGQAYLPKTVSFPWQGDKNFTITVERKDLKEIKPSQFLASALKIYNETNPSGNENLDVDRMLSPVVSMLDTSASGTLVSPPANGVSAAASAQSYFGDVTVTAAWNTGDQKQKLSTTLFLIDRNVLASLPSATTTNPNKNTNPQQGGTPGGPTPGTNNPPPLAPPGGGK